MFRLKVLEVLVAPTLNGLSIVGASMCADASLSRSAPHARRSSHQIGLVDDATRLAAADADEDPLVQPVERWCCRFDPCRGPEGVFGRVDVLATAEAGEDLSGAVTNAA